MSSVWKSHVCHMLQFEQSGVVVSLKKKKNRANNSNSVFMILVRQKKTNKTKTMSWQLVCMQYC